MNITPLKIEHHESVDAIVLAGGDGEALGSERMPKGLFSIAGKPMLEWVVDALHEAKSIRRIVLVVPGYAHIPDSVREKLYAVAESDGSFTENMVAGIEATQSDRHIVGVTGDIPALTPEAIDDFIAKTHERGADFSYPLIRKEAMETQFPGSTRTYFKVKGGSFTGGNMLVGSPALAIKIKDIIQGLFDTRKNPIKMMKIIGPMFAVKLATGNLDVTDFETKLADIFGGPCAAIYTDFASIGADVDKPEDVGVTEHALVETKASIG